MTRPLSPIHRPLDEEGVKPFEYPPASRVTRLAALDQHQLAGRAHSLGPGGASSVFARAVEKALIDEAADQMRFDGENRPDTEIARWAAEIITAFCESAS